MATSPLISTDTERTVFYSETVFVNLPRLGTYHTDIPFYVKSEPSTDPETLDIISEKTKVFVQLTTSFYHFIHDQLGSILYYHEEYPDYEIIVDIAHALPHINSGSKLYDDVFEMLEISGIKISKIDSSKINGININNFLFPYMNIASKNIPERLSKFFIRFIKNPEVLPFKNVYLSRTGLDYGRDYSDRRDSRRGYPDILFNDARVDDSPRLDNFFVSHGFEVITPEQNFKNFYDQLNYMYSVKTLISISGSGLTNSIFMQPGQTVVEITSPMVTTTPPQYSNSKLEEYTADIHLFFSPLSFKKNHVHISVPNMQKNTSDVIKTLLTNPVTKNIIDSVSKNVGNRFWKKILKR